MSIQNRQPKGIPVGGQYAVSTKGAATGVTLLDDRGDEDAIGSDLERITVAAARRALPVGTIVQVHYLNRAPGTAEPIVRTVAKQTDHEMCTENEDGRLAHLQWAKQQAYTDASGNVIVCDDEGTPYVTYRTLADTADAVTGPVAVHPDLAVHAHDIRQCTDAETLDSYAESRFGVDRREVASNPHTAPHTLARLADDEDVKVRRLVAGNPHTPNGALARLARDTDEAPGLNETRVAWLVANNPSSDPGVLRHLANDDDAMVRSAVGRHGGTDPETLRLLGTVPAPGHKYVDQDVRHSVASNPNTPSDVLARWEKSDGWTMPQIAKNPNTPADVLVRLSTDTSTGNQTRAMVATNPSVPADVLTRLAGEDDNWVREHAAKNPRLGARDAERLSRDSDERVRRALAGNASAATPEALLALAGDKSHFVRRLVAKNPAAPVEALRTLAADEASIVAETARDRLG